MPSSTVVLSDSSEYDFTVEWGRTSLASSSAYDVAVYDTGVYDGAGGDIAWQDATQFVYTIATKRGKDQFLKRVRTGTVKLVLDNTNGRWSEADAGFTPGDFVRIRVNVKLPNPDNLPATVPDLTTWDGVTGREWTSHGDLILDDPDLDEVWPIFYGRVDSSIDKMFRGQDSTVLQLVDQFADFAVFDRDAVAAEGAGDTTRERMERIFLIAGFDFNDVEEFGSEQFTMQATTLAQPALNLLQITMDSAGGDFWAMPGRGFGIGFTDWLTAAPRSVNIQWSLGGGLIGIEDANPSRQLQLIVNDATFSNAGGVSQNTTDSTSIARYGHRTTRRLDLVGDNDAQAQQLAARVVNNLSVARPRVREVQVRIVDSRSAEFASQALVGDLVLTDVSSFRGWGTTFLGHIVGLSSSVVGDQWTVTMKLDDAFVEVGLGGGFDNEAFSTGYDLGEL